MVVVVVVAAAAILTFTYRRSRVVRFSEPNGCASEAEGGAGGRNLSNDEKAFVGSDSVVS